MKRIFIIAGVLVLSISVSYSYLHYISQSNMNTCFNLTPKQIALNWIEAYNSHNPDTAASLYDENVTNTQLPYGKTVHGRDAMRISYENIFRAFPDIHIEVINIIEQDSWIVVEWVFSGTMKGEFAGHLPNNNKFNMSGCEIFQIINGKISIQRGYWDKNTMVSQLKLDSN